MIDIESSLFSEIAPQLRAAFPGIFVTGEYVHAPAQFPAVSIVETRNATWTRGQTNAPQTNFSELTYTVDVYSNLKTGRKTQCKQIAEMIDDFFIARNFTGTGVEPIPNLEDATIYRMVGRYRAIVGRDNALYRA